MPPPIRNARTTPPSFDPSAAGDDLRATPPRTAAAPTHRTAPSQLAGLPSRPRAQPPRQDPTPASLAPRGNTPAGSATGRLIALALANPAANRTPGRLAGGRHLPSIDNGNPVLASRNFTFGELAEASVAALLANYLRPPSIALDDPQARGPAPTPLAGLQLRTRALSLAQEPSGLGSVHAPLAFLPDIVTAALANSNRLRDLPDRHPASVLANRLRGVGPARSRPIPGTRAARGSNPGRLGTAMPAASQDRRCMAPRAQPGREPSVRQPPCPAERLRIVPARASRRVPQGAGRHPATGRAQRCLPRPVF
uniref:Type III effector protein n=1 Tax=Ralstonia solanacearum TaxID=305 RepID=A0A0S4VEI2_RALSL|nr:protein of unknown function [Ralstonia solanacearum]CUV32769.1 protein of unknown function [Ralstonia solanacearum]CUV38583.1 protein of unknown function [Ralstonia solanacearum]CUV63338.1 protein of unknown function [Ralstonia solanacearum]